MRAFTLLCAVLLAGGLHSRAQEPPTNAERFDEPLRPRIHFTPPSNFMNDPNGLVFFEGEYHLFYQHNPFGERWGHMSWGHAVSRDLLHWEHLPVALREEDGIMIFSGSAVVDRTDSSGLCGGRPCLVAIYTGHTEKKQTQNLAFSIDRGRTWAKYPGNPVVDLGLKDFRDPKVFWHEDTKRWVMVTVLPDQHKVRLFSSRDLKRWDMLSDFGPAGAIGGVWECPDLFPLAVEGTGETRWVLDVDLNPGGIAGGSGGQYFVGRFDGRTFVNDAPASETLWSDYGKDFYATISFSDMPPTDGRRIWMAWMSNWLYANEEPTGGWRGALSVPRELSLRRTPAGLHLVQRPVRELDALRTGAEPVRLAASTALPAAAEFTLRVAASTAGDVGQGSAPRGATTAVLGGLRLSNASGEEALIGVAGPPLEVFVDRRRSRSSPLAHYPGRHAGPVRTVDGGVRLRVIVDRSTVEVFANDGETVVSDRLWPTRPFTRVEPVHGAGVRTPLEIWTLRSVWGGR